MIDVSIGIGKSDDAKRAAVDAATQALATLPNKRADCALVFASSIFPQEEIRAGLSEVLQNTKVVGCSSAWEISSEGLVSEGSIVVVCISSDQVKFSSGFGPHLEWNGSQSGKECLSAIDDTSSAVLFFVNTLSGGAEKAFSTMSEKFGDDTKIVIGGASDDLRFFETYQILDNNFYSDAVVGLGISGMFGSEFVSTHGFLPVGVLKKITKVRDNAIVEIDGHPAVNLYEEYFADQFVSMVISDKLMSFASSYPLGIYEDESIKPTLRVPTRINIDSGEIFCEGTVPVNSGLRLMISDRHQNIKTAHDAAVELMAKLNGKKPKLVLMISSVSRRKILGNMDSMEIREVQEIIGLDVPIAGYYSYAEFVDENKLNKEVMLNNGSLILFAITE